MVASHVFTLITGPMVSKINNRLYSDSKMVAVEPVYPSVPFAKGLGEVYSTLRRAAFRYIS